MKRRSIAARVMTIILSVCMVFTMCPFISDGWNNSGHAEAATKITDKKVYRNKGYKSGDCVLSANIYMMRRAAIARGGKWKGINNNGNVRHKIATGINDVRFKYEYTYGGITFNGRHGYLTGSVKTKKKTLKKLLDKHPEGVVVWQRSPMHGILVTSYYYNKKKEIKFMAADSTHNAAIWYAKGKNKGIEKLKNTTIPSISKWEQYWYLSSVTVKKSCTHCYWNSKSGNSKAGTRAAGYYTNICTECQADYTPSVSDASTKGKYFQFINPYDVREYPDSQGKVLRPKEKGTVTVCGVVTDHTDWYQVKIGNIIGYAEKSSIQEYKPESTLAISNLKDLSFKRGSTYDIPGQVNSNYPLTKIKGYIIDTNYAGTLDTGDFGTNAKSVSIKGTQINKQIKCDKLAKGTYQLCVEAWDSYPNHVTNTVTIDVYGVSKPNSKTTIKSKGRSAAKTADEQTDTKTLTGGKTATITQTEAGATLYYQIGDQPVRSTEEGSVTTPLITEPTQIKSYSVLDGEASTPDICDVDFEELIEPELEATQIGDREKIILLSDDRATVMYRLNEDSFSEYNGQEIWLNDKETITYYAKADGYYNSSVETYTAELDAPDIPEVKLLNSSNTVPAGKNIIVSWQQDNKATTYSAELHKASDDSVVQEIETTEATASFTLSEEGEYYITVAAQNAIDASESSAPVKVFAKDKLTVTFRDADVDGHPGDIINQVIVEYGSNLSRVDNPSRKGHEFKGWADDDGTVSQNGYLNKAIDRDQTFVATYEPLSYKVKLYNHNGEYLKVLTFHYGDSLRGADDAEGLTESQHKVREIEDTINGSLEPGYALQGWQVTGTTDEESIADSAFIDSNMEVHAVVSWDQPELPVKLSFVQDPYQSGDTIKAKVAISNDEAQDISIYLIWALKSQDTGKDNLSKTVYTDRKIVELPGGNASASQKEVDLEMRPNGSGGSLEGINQVEITAVEKRPDMTTGSAYSESLKKTVQVDAGWGNWSSWSNTQYTPVDNQREVETKTVYRYRDKETKETGNAAESGWTKESTRQISSSGPTAWTPSKLTGSTTYATNGMTVVTVESKSAYKSYAYYCPCVKWCWTNKNASCKYCGKSTPNLLQVFSSVSLKNSGYKKDTDGSYFMPKTVSTSSPGKMGTIYCMKYKGNAVTSFTTKSSSGHVFMWPDGTATIYRSTTKKYLNKWYRWKSWTGWSDTVVTANANRQVETQTWCRYRDKVMADSSATVDLDPEGTLAYHFDSEHNRPIQIDQDLSGKKATIMVYQTCNTDPNKYQMQYLGQTEIGENNSYSFDFIPRELKPTADSGNFIVALAIQGTSGLVNVGVIETDKPEYVVKPFYMKNGDTKQYFSLEYDDQPITVKEHENIDLSKIDIPEREGYVFLGWRNRTTDIAPDCLVDGICEIEAVYAPVTHAVAFVDWINQTLDLRTAVTGEKLVLPSGTDSVDGYVFKGWKLEEGTLLTVDPEPDPEDENANRVEVTGNMIITAEYEPIQYEVKFIGANGEVVGEPQLVNYGEAATPPSYTAPEGQGKFVGWSTDNNWWSVEQDVEVRAIIVYSEQALAPTSRIVTNDETNERSLELETDEADATVFYTVDGTTPSAGMIREYIETPEEDSYKGSIREYTKPISFSDFENDQENPDEATEPVSELDITAVSYVEGKDPSKELVVLFEKEPSPDDAEEPFADWNEVGTYDVKAKAGKDIQLNVDLENNPGITGYDFMIETDRGAFYAETNDYGNPIVTEGSVSKNGDIITSDQNDGWRVSWSSLKASEQDGTLFTMDIHTSEQVEEGTYQFTVNYAPEYTLDKDYLQTKLDGVKVSFDSEASININTLEATLSRYSYVYEGEACEPVVRIEGLKEGTDFTVEYENNVDVGTAKAIITGMGDYTGTVEKEFTITPVNIANAEIAQIGDQVKTGSAIEPEVNITYNGTPLVRGTDYEATFTDNVEVGTAGVAISGKGNFKGTTEAQFNIIETTESRLEAAEAAVAELEQQLADMETEKESIQQQLTQAQNSYNDLLTEKNGLETQLADLQTEKTALEQREAELLQQKAELEENAQENQQALAEIQDELDGITAQKEQLETDLQNAQNEKDAIEQQLTQAQTTVNDLTAQKETLETRNTELQNELNNAQAEIARLQKALEESKADSLDEVKVSGIGNRVYTGSALQQTLTVTVGGKTLVNGTDYTVAYKNNKNVGTATVTISGKNEYRGTFSRTFKINPKGTTISKLVKGKKMMTVKWKKQAVQTTGYQIRYSLKKNFKSGVKTVTVKGPKTTSKVIKKLKAKKTYYVQVRTYKTVSGKKYYSAWSKTKYVKTK